MENAGSVQRPAKNGWDGTAETPLGERRGRRSSRKRVILAFATSRPFMQGGF